MLAFTFYNIAAHSELLAHSTAAFCSQPEEVLENLARAAFMPQTL